MEPQPSLSILCSPSYSTITVNLFLSNPGVATLRVFNLAGRKVAEANLGELETGSTINQIDMSAQSTGAYFIVCQIGSISLYASAVLLNR